MIIPHISLKIAIITFPFNKKETLGLNAQGKHHFDTKGRHRPTVQNITD
jgi:hypothetical protein